jgi:60 kDa SS-A/Ro ribonucleoprotein
MGHRYLSGAPTRRSTPQDEAIPGAGQVENSAGGYVWAVSPLTRLRRFLILGTEGGSFYADERTLTAENVKCLAECDPVEAVNLIRDISHEGLAAKNDPAIFALAYYAAHESAAVRQYALAQLPAVCRTSTHLFHFAEFVQSQRGWGRSLRRAVGGWYARQAPRDLAYQAVKYRQRGWVDPPRPVASRPSGVAGVVGEPHLASVG